MLFRNCYVCTVWAPHIVQDIEWLKGEPHNLLTGIIILLVFPVYLNHLASPLYNLEETTLSCY